MSQSKVSVKLEQKFKLRKTNSRQVFIALLLASCALSAALAAPSKTNQRAAASAPSAVKAPVQQAAGKTGAGNQASPLFASRPQQAPQVEQQQQQAEEPTDAAEQSPAIAAPAIASPAIAAPAAEEAEPRPEPYSFSYAFDAADSTSAGSSARAEQQTADGVVTGKLI